MKAMFTRLGIPKLVFSDNGLEFTSLEFTKFSANWYFEHDTSSPEFAHANGMVWRTIQEPLLKSRDDKDLALLTLCTAPGMENILSLGKENILSPGKENILAPATKRMKCEL